MLRQVYIADISATHISIYEAYIQLKKKAITKLTWKHIKARHFHDKGRSFQIPNKSSSNTPPRWEDTHHSRFTYWMDMFHNQTVIKPTTDWASGASSLASSIPTLPHASTADESPTQASTPADNLAPRAGSISQRSLSQLSYLLWDRRPL